MTAVCSQAQPRKVAATAVAEMPALWLWIFCSPHDQPGAAAQPQPAREAKKKEKRKTPLQSPKRKFI
jgi:hypothetical protein